MVPVLAIASFFVYHKVAATADFQRQVRAAQADRGTVLRVQLNEETGMRGYTSTGDREFLAPYVLGRTRSFHAFDRFERAVRVAGLDDALGLIRRERQLNDVWVHDYAQPLIADPSRSSRTLVLQRGAKARVDEFRFIDKKIQNILEVAATAADERSERAISSILVSNVILLSALTLAALGFGYLQSRASRMAFESRVLYENEKRIADALQEAFLQKSLPFTPGVGLHATYVPASREAQVGGDWYDAFELPDKRVLFSIGDVAGHGLDAAVVMNRARQSILSAALHENDPATVLERANRSLMLQDSRMVTAICGYLDPKTREIVYATAGHPAPVMARRDAPAEFLPHEGLPLGIVPDAPYVTFRTFAPPDGMMVLYTDGVLEHKRDVIGGQERLLEAARKSVDEDDPALAIQRYVFEESGPTDDVAILAVSFRKFDGDGETPVVNAFQLNRWQAAPAGDDSSASETVAVAADGSNVRVEDNLLVLVRSAASV